MQPQDAVLLKRWSESRDAEAFDALVSRHASMVYATCKRILGNASDAEELTQECFLKLATGGSRIRMSPGGWLHSVATSLAINRIRADVRRSRREHVAATETSSPVEPTWDDLRQHVDEAIAQLPERLREPLIRHFLQRETHEKIALDLGIGRTAVTKRIARAIEQVRETLRKRGLPITAALLAAFASEHMVEAAPASLTSDLGRLAVSGVAGPAAVGLLSLTWAKAALSVVVVLALGAGALIAYGRTIPPPTQKNAGPAASNTRSALVETAREPARKIESSNEPLVVASLPEPTAPVPNAQTSPGLSGRVVDEAGQAVPGAEVSLFHEARYRGPNDKVVDRAVSGEDGGFALTVSPEFESSLPHAYAQDKYVVFATHPGHALGWKTLKPDDATSNLELVMTPPTSGTLTVTDPLGAPIEGARVWLCAAGTNESSRMLFRKTFGIHSDPGIVSAATDNKGQVTFKNLPDTNCSFNAHKPGYALSWSPLPNRTMNLTRGASVSGRVATVHGLPAPDVEVWFDADWMHDPHMTRTDTEGRYAFTDLPANGWDMSVWEEGTTGNGQYKVRIVSERFTMPEQTVQLEPDDAITNYDLTAYGGTTVHCRVVWPDSKEPVAGARILGSNDARRIEGYTDVQGVWTFAALPGEVRLSFLSPPDGVYVDDEVSGNSSLDFEAVGREMDVTLMAPPLAGTLIPARGQIAKGPFSFDDVKVHPTAGSYKTATSFGYVPPSVEVDAKTGQFQLSDIPAGRTLILYAGTDDHRYAGIAEYPIPGEAKEFDGLAVALQATQSGSIVLTDDSGAPYANLKLEFEPVVNDIQLVWVRREAETDAGGRLELDGLLSGMAYHFFTFEDTPNGGQLNRTEVIAP